MKIWDVSDWKEVPERLRTEAGHSILMCGRAYLFQDDSTVEPIIIDPQWVPFMKVIGALMAYVKKGGSSPIFPPAP